MYNPNSIFIFNYIIIYLLLYNKNMSSIQTIELRQLDSQSVLANGDYEIQLSKDITINNGDVVQLKNAFIDTINESLINIIDDLTLTIKSCVYLTNWYRWSDQVATAVEVSGVAYANSPDFKRYIPYLGNQIGGASFYSLFVSIKFQLITIKSFDSFQITLSYQNIYGIMTQVNVTMPGQSKNTFKPIEVPVNVIAYEPIALVFVSISVADLESIYGIGFSGFIQTDIQEVLYEPFSMTTTMILPKGNYTPVQISTFISQELSKTGLKIGTENQNMTNSKFLLSTSDFDVGRASPDGRLNPNGTPALLSEQTYFISDDGQVLLQFKPNSNFLIGSSQIGLEFDPNTNKFQWTQIHSNMLDSTAGTDIAVRYLRYNFAQDGEVFGVANNGGIFFNSLTAFDTNGNYVSFWDKILGFDLNTLCVGNTFYAQNIFGRVNVKYNLSNPLTVGKSITDGYYGLDSTVIRGTPASGTPPNYNLPYTWIFRQPVPFFDGNVPGTEIPIAQAGISSTINSTIAIIASETIDDLLNKFSHYILQTDLGFSNNDFIGIDYSKNINGVISKYYSYGSYVASLESEGAIQYVHSGNSIQLKSIRVRLLTSSKVLDTTLGKDNTIIFEIIKAPPVVNKP